MFSERYTCIFYENYVQFLKSLLSSLISQKWRPGDLSAMGGSITYYPDKYTDLWEYWTSAESRSFFKVTFILPFLQTWGSCWGYLGQVVIFAGRGRTTQNPDKSWHLWDIIGHSLKIYIHLKPLWSADWLCITSVYAYLYFCHVHGNNGAQEVFPLDLVKSVFFTQSLPYKEKFILTFHVVL